MRNCPHCKHELTKQEIGALYALVGGLALADKKAKLSVKSTLTQKDVDNIRKSKKSIYNLAEKYNVSYMTIWRVKKNKTRLYKMNCPHCNHELTRHEIGRLFASVGGSTTSPLKTKRSILGGLAVAKITQQDANNIRKSKLKAKELAEKYKVSEDTIYRVRRNEIWKGENP